MEVDLPCTVKGSSRYAARVWSFMFLTDFHRFETCSKNGMR